MVKQFEAEYGEDWDDTLMVGYDNDFVSLPVYVVRAAKGGTGRNLRILLQWLGEANIKGKINAKCESVGNMGLLYIAAYTEQRDLMSYLLLNGADVNILNSSGGSVIAEICYDGNICHVTNDVSTTIKMLLSWGADLFLDGRHVTSPKGVQRSHTNISREGDVTIAKLVSSELDGRRCEIVSAPNARDDLVGKTCLVEEYIKASDQYKVTMEFTNESLLLRADNLKRRDRTPQDPGYYVECKNNRLIRHDFKSNEECQAFIASLDVEDEKMAAVDPDSEAKADQAAADLLAELGLDDLEGPSSSAPKKGKPQSVPAGKKKKRGSGKKKGRK